MQFVMNVVRRFLQDAKERVVLAKKFWPGRPGYLGFALLGVGGLLALRQASCWAELGNAENLERAQYLISALSGGERGMAALLFAALMAFIAEQRRMFQMVRAAKGERA